MVASPTPWFRSKEIEAIGCNGDAAFLEVRVQQLVIEFILNHVDQIFNNIKASSMENDGNCFCCCMHEPPDLCTSFYQFLITVASYQLSLVYPKSPYLYPTLH